MIRTRVLVVEDDEKYHLIYQHFFDLHAEEFTLVLAKTGDAAIAAIKDDPHPFQAALIDWYLRNGFKNGLQVLQAVRDSSRTRNIVAFMVTANECDHDIRAAIEAGADDYIIKPFKMELLAARLRGRLDRAKKQQPVAAKALELDGLRLSPGSGIVELHGHVLDLKKTEVAILQVLLERPDRILAQDFLWHEVRGYESGTAGKALTIQISNLRKKLGAWSEHIETYRDQGYMLNTRLAVS